MSFTTALNSAKQKALDAMLSDRIQREEARAVAEWQAKVKAVREFEAKQTRELTDLKVQEAAALRELERLRPQWQGVNRKYGFARRKHTDRRTDLSELHGQLVSSAENAAPAAFHDLIDDIVVMEKQLRNVPTNERQIFSGRVDRRGRAEYRTESDYPEIARRLQTLRQLRERVEQLRTEVIDDPAAELAKIRSEAVAAAKM